MLDTPLQRRTYLAATGAVTAALASFSGCIGRGQAGTLATQVTDQPGDIADFESCVVTITGMWLGPEEARSGEADDVDPAGREYYAYDEPQEADLVQLQDGETQLVDERELNVASYEFLQLEIDGIDAVLENGSEATLEVPGAAPVTFNESFRIRAETRTVFTADFTPVRRGQTDEYVLQPVPEGISIEYGEE